VTFTTLRSDVHNFGLQYSVPSIAKNHQVEFTSTIRQSLQWMGGWGRGGQGVNKKRIGKQIGLPIVMDG